MHSLSGCSKVSRFQFPTGWYHDSCGPPWTMKHERSAGSRTAWGVIRSHFRTPSESAELLDHDASVDGKGRAVTCWLKGEMDPFPKRSRQGILELNSAGVAWRPSWGIRRERIVFADPIESLEIRRTGPAEWNMKKGGKAYGVLAVPEFLVLVCKTERGVLELAVSGTDVTLVRTALLH